MSEGNQLGKDKPGLNPLDVGGGGELLYYTDQKGGGGQHHGQVHCDGSVEEVWQLEERGCVAYGDKEQ